jgi:hypothetical protein
MCFLCRPCRKQQEKSKFSIVRHSSVSKVLNTGAEEATALEAVTRRQPVKTQQTEKTQYVL